MALVRRPAVSERRLLQLAIAIAGLVPVTAGFAGVFWGPSVFEPGAAGVSLDSHVRYLSGLLLGIGLAFWSFIPRIESVTTPARILTALVLIGGLARLLGLALHGMPSPGMAFGLVMELIVTPLLCLWQGRVARIARASCKEAASSAI
ncbi:MAG: DUF4345 domain-containing protein [Hyphomicrobium sp.]